MAGPQAVLEGPKCLVQTGAPRLAAPFPCQIATVGSSMKSLGLRATSTAPARRVSRQTCMVAAEVGSSVGEAAAATLRKVLVESEVGETYEKLQKHLAAAEWEAADAETRRLLCVLAGEGAQKRKWVYFTEVQTIPSKDILTIDRLWRAYSDDRFGYSIQRRIWKALGQMWKPFLQKIEWTQGENNNYKKWPTEFTWENQAPTGHLPLTNFLRGTQLLVSIFGHPAFASFDDEQVMPEDMKLPDYTAKPAESSSDSASTAGLSKPNLTGSIFDEDFNSSDYGF